MMSVADLPVELQLEIAKAVVAVGTALSAICAAVIGYMNKKHLQEIHVQINGRLSQLLEAENAMGRLQERSEQRILDGISKNLEGIHQTHEDLKNKST